MLKKICLILNLFYGIITVNAIYLYNKNSYNLSKQNAQKFSAEVLIFGDNAVSLRVIIDSSWIGTSA